MATQLISRLMPTQLTQLSPRRRTRPRLRRLPSRCRRRCGRRRCCRRRRSSTPARVSMRSRMLLHPHPTSEWRVRRRALPRGRRRAWHATSRSLTRRAEGPTSAAEHLLIWRATLARARACRGGRAKEARACRRRTGRRRTAWHTRVPAPRLPSSCAISSITPALSTRPPTPTTPTRTRRRQGRPSSVEAPCLWSRGRVLAGKARC